MANINRTFFFHFVRLNLFGGKLSEKQVKGMTEILNYWESNHFGDDDRWLAYMMATAYHETDRKMQAVEEYGKGKGKDYGKPDPATGQRYYGRGLVQLTWKKNYQTMTDIFNVDLVLRPELALDLNLSIKIMFFGMINGSFTTKQWKLKDFFNATKEDWVSARRIINGLDKAELIAGFGKQFYAAISYSP